MFHLTAVHLLLLVLLARLNHVFLNFFEDDVLLKHSLLDLLDSEVDLLSEVFCLVLKELSVAILKLDKLTDGLRGVDDRVRELWTVSGVLVQHNYDLLHSLLLDLSEIQILVCNQELRLKCLNLHDLHILLLLLLMYI